MPPAMAGEPKMNREQRRRCEKFLKTTEGKAKLAAVKAKKAKDELNAARLAEAMGQKQVAVSPELYAKLAAVS